MPSPQSTAVLTLRPSSSIWYGYAQTCKYQEVPSCSAWYEREYLLDLTSTTPSASNTTSFSTSRLTQETTHEARKLFESEVDLSMTKRFVAAMIILQAKAPVQYMMLVSTEIIWTRRIPTAATCGCYVYINPDFWDSLETDAAAFLLAHEVPTSFSDTAA